MAKTANFTDVLKINIPVIFNANSEKEVSYNVFA